MPDILIRGMEMPRTCSDCPMCYDMMECTVSPLRFWYGRPENEQFDFCKERHPDCPLVELPAHGDLISRDAALSHPFANGQYDRENANRHFIGGHESYKEWLEDFPVIVPASEEVADENP